MFLSQKNSQHEVFRTDGRGLSNNEILYLSLGETKLFGFGEIPARINFLKLSVIDGSYSPGLVSITMAE